MSRVSVFRRIIVLPLAFLLGTGLARAQFTDCSTGLLQMPTAEMQPDGTFMITNNFINKHSLPSSGWSYNTIQYGIAISFWKRIEIGYVCTLFNDRWKGSQTRPGVTMINQDRHFTARVLLIHENEFGLKWMPALVVGISDPITGTAGDYAIRDVDGFGNGFFNRNFIVLTKHFFTSLGKIGVHAGYQINWRVDNPINAPCAGVCWNPSWFENKGVLDDIGLIIEFDSHTANMGFVASILDNHVEAIFELQNFQWINFGFRYKLRLKS